MDLSATNTTWSRRLLAMAAAAVTALTALIMSAAPVSAANSISLNAQGSWSGSGTRVNVGGTATCDSAGGIGTVTLTLRQGNITGAGQTNVVCDGAPHSFGGTVFGGPFQLGNAVLTAELTTTTGTARQTRTINIVL